MSKAKIIIISIIVSIIAVLAILFGAVFRLRSQSVDFVGENNLAITSDEIIKSAKLKNGTSIFLLNKENTEENIEKAYAELKVIQIKTTSVQSIEIRVRQRDKIFYAESENKYYVLDEDLKVLEILEERPTGLTEIKDELNLSNKTKVCDFVGTKKQQTITYGLVVAMITTVKNGNDAESEYLNKKDIPNIIKEIKFSEGYTSSQKYTRLIMKTGFGVNLDIAKSENNIQKKINKCFAAVQALSDEQRASGTIKLTYNNSGEEILGYIE